MKKLNWGQIKYYLYCVVITCLYIGILIQINNLFRMPEVVTVSYEPVQKSKTTKTEYIEAEPQPHHTRDIQMNTIDLSIEDAQLLMQVAQAEAGNQGIDGQWLVMSVVLNRVENEDFPNSIKEVIYQPHQFSTVSNGTIDTVTPTPDTHYALARIEGGDVAPEIVAFETTESKTLDKYFSCAFTYRNHQFYTLHETDN